MGSKANKCLCCGCPPSKCYNQYLSITPLLLSVDFGNLACCNGNAGGVKTLRWNGGTWASSLFWCDPNEDGEDCCGTAKYRWDEPSECGEVTYVYECQTIEGEGGSTITFCQWNLQGPPCPTGCIEQETSRPSNPPEGTTWVSTCLPIQTEAVWTLLSSTCICGQSAVPPDRDGAYDGEEVTVTCPGNGGGTLPPEDIPCTDGYINEVLWSGDTLPPPSNFVSLPGTVRWVWGPLQLTHGWGYGISFNGCDPLESAQTATPDWSWSPGDLCPGEGGPPTGVPKYVITACTGAPCPPEGYVAGRWLLIPPTIDTPALLELRIGGIVKIRYNMYADRVFNQACLNKMQLEDSGCSLPCANIPEFVCVRPYDINAGTCLPYGQSFTMTIPPMTVTNPGIGAITAGQMSQAAGEYAFDLIDNNGWDPRWEDNGCRSSEVTCCTWLAPRSDLVTSGIFCEHTGWLGWVLQTCDPQSRHGLNAKRLENYDCSGDAMPVLRFGIYIYEKFETGLVGPALIRWTAFRGPSFGDTIGGDPPSAPLCCGPGVCGVSEACTDPGNEGGYYDPEQVYAYGYWLTWLFKEILEDGTLVMRMSDVDYSGWVTAFPQEIELSPS